MPRLSLTTLILVLSLALTSPSQLLLARSVSPSPTSDLPALTVCGVEIPPFILKHPYAYRLIFAKGDRAVTHASLLSDGRIRIDNIFHKNELWSADIDPLLIVAAEVINQPIAPKVFHFGALFDFGERGITLYQRGNRSTQIRELIMGTGPEKAFSIDGTIGFQLLQMRASSLEAFQGKKPLEAKVRNRLNPERVDIVGFFLAEAEEAARLAALTAIRALRAEYPEKTDMPEVQKYHFLGANCVSSGIQNLTRSIRPAYHHFAKQLVRKDVDEFQEWNPALACQWIKSWNELTLLAFDGLRGGRIDWKKLSEVSAFHKNLRSHNQMSLPWRAEPIIKWAAGK